MGRRYFVYIIEHVRVRGGKETANIAFTFIDTLILLATLSFILISSDEVPGHLIN